MAAAILIKANPSTLNRSTIQLRTLRSVHPDLTAKFWQSTEIWFSAVKDFERCLAIQSFGRCTIFEVHRMLYSFSPQELWKTASMQHGSNLFEKSTVKSFG